MAQDNNPNQAALDLFKREQDAFPLLGTMGRQVAPQEPITAMDDIKTSLGVGALNVPSMLTGALDAAYHSLPGLRPQAFGVPTPEFLNRPFDKVTNAIADVVTPLDFDAKAKAWEDSYSQTVKDQRQAIQDEEGFLATLGAAAENPRAIGTYVGESIAPMFAGGVAARTALAPGMTTRIAAGMTPVLNPILAGALGEGVVSAGSAMNELADAGLDPGLAAQGAMATGATTAGIGFAGGRIADKLGITDADTLLGGLARATVPKGAAQNLAGKTAGWLGRVAAGGATEGFEEMLQSGAESIIANLAENKPWNQELGDSMALGLATGAPMGAAFASIPRRTVQEFSFAAKDAAEADKVDLHDIRELFTTKDAQTAIGENATATAVTEQKAKVAIRKEVAKREKDRNNRRKNKLSEEQLKTAIDEKVEEEFQAQKEKHLRETDDVYSIIADLSEDGAALDAPITLEQAETLNLRPEDVVRQPDEQNQSATISVREALGFMAPRTLEQIEIEIEANKAANQEEAAEMQRRELEGKRRAFEQRSRSEKIKQKAVSKKSAQAVSKVVTDLDRELTEEDAAVFGYAAGEIPRVETGQGERNVTVREALAEKSILALAYLEEAEALAQEEARVAKENDALTPSGDPALGRQGIFDVITGVEGEAGVNPVLPNIASNLDKIPTKLQREALGLVQRADGTVPNLKKYDAYGVEQGDMTLGEILDRYDPELKAALEAPKPDTAVEDIFAEVYGSKAYKATKFYRDISAAMESGDQQKVDDVLDTYGEKGMAEKSGAVFAAIVEMRDAQGVNDATQKVQQTETPAQETQVKPETPAQAEPIAQEGESPAPAKRPVLKKPKAAYKPQNEREKVVDAVARGKVEGKVMERRAWIAGAIAQELGLPAVTASSDVTTVADSLLDFMATPKPVDTLYQLYMGYQESLDKKPVSKRQFEKDMQALGLKAKDADVAVVTLDEVGADKTTGTAYQQRESLVQSAVDAVAQVMASKIPPEAAATVDFPGLVAGFIESYKQSPLANTTDPEEFIGAAIAYMRQGDPTLAATVPTVDEVVSVAKETMAADEIVRERDAQAVRAADVMDATGAETAAGRIQNTKDMELVTASSWADRLTDKILEVSRALKDADTATRVGQSFMEKVQVALEQSTTENDTQVEGAQHVFAALNAYANRDQASLTPAAALTKPSDIFSLVVSNVENDAETRSSGVNTFGFTPKQMQALWRAAEKVKADIDKAAEAVVETPVPEEVVVTPVDRARAGIAWALLDDGEGNMTSWQSLDDQSQRQFVVFIRENLGAGNMGALVTRIAASELTFDADDYHTAPQQPIEAPTKREALMAQNAWEGYRSNFDKTANAPSIPSFESLSPEQQARWAAGLRDIGTILGEPGQDQAGTLGVVNNSTAHVMQGIMSQVVQSVDIQARLSAVESIGGAPQGAWAQLRVKGRTELSKFKRTAAKVVGAFGGTVVSIGDADVKWMNRVGYDKEVDAKLEALMGSLQGENNVLVVESQAAAKMLYMLNLVPGKDWHKWDGAHISADGLNVPVVNTYNLRSRAEAEATLAHEFHGHHALRQSKTYNEVAREAQGVFKLLAGHLPVDEYLNTYWDNVSEYSALYGYKGDKVKPESAIFLVDELLARISEDAYGSLPNVVQRKVRSFAARISMWLRSVGMNQWADFFAGEGNKNYLWGLSNAIDLAMRKDNPRMVADYLNIMIGGKHGTDKGNSWRRVSQTGKEQVVEAGAADAAWLSRQESATRETDGDRFVPADFAARFSRRGSNQQPKPEPERNWRDTLADAWDSIERTVLYRSFDATMGFSTSLHTLTRRLRPYMGDIADKYKHLRYQIEHKHDQHARAAAQIQQQALRLSNSELAQLDKFLYETDKKRAWGFQPEWLDTQVLVDPEVRASFERLPPKLQLMAKDIQQNMHELAVAMHETSRIGVEESYNKLIAEARTQKEASLLQREKAYELGLLADAAEGLNRPYMPHERDGGIVVIAKSNRHNEAVAELNRLDEELALLGDEAMDSPLREKRLEVLNQIQEMRKTPSDYSVVFTSFMGVNKVRASLIERGFKDSEIAEGNRSLLEDHESIPSAMLDRIRAKLASAQAASATGKPNAASEKADANVNAALERLRASTLRNGALKATEMYREDVDGYETTMTKAYVNRARLMAHTLTQVEMREPVERALYEMSARAKEIQEVDARRRAVNLVNNIIRLHLKATNPDVRDSRFSNDAAAKAMGVNAHYNLLMSPSYYAQNIAQPFMMSATWIAGRHGLTNTETQLGVRIKEITEAVVKTYTGRKADQFRRHGLLLDTTQFTPHRQEMLDRLGEMRMLDIGMNADMGATLDSRNAVSRTYSKSLDVVSTFNRNVEVITRAATVLTAYDMEYEKQRQSGKSPAAAHEAAMDYGIEAVERTLGNYSHANAGFMFTMWGTKSALLFQFRKFQVILLEHVVEMVRDAKLLGVDTRGMDQAQIAEATQAAKEARASLFYSLAGNGVLFGARALPGASLISGIFSLGMAMFGGGDEPADAELAFRMMLRDMGLSAEAQDVILNGLQTQINVNMTTMLGWGDMTSIFPFVDADASREGMKEWVFAALGTTGGTLENLIAKPVELMMEEEWERAFTQMLPRGPRGAVSAYNMDEGGLKTLSGKTIFSPKELSVSDRILHGLSIQSQHISAAQEDLGAIYKIEEFITKKEDLAVRKFIKAVSGNANMREAILDFAEVQRIKLDFGIKPSKLSDILTRGQRRMVNDMRRYKGARITERNAVMIMEMKEGR